MAGLAALSVRRLPVSLGAVVLALAVPVLFLHSDLEPSVSVAAGASDATLYLVDVVVLVLAGFAVYAGRTLGWGPLRAGLPVFLAVGAWLVLVVAGTFYPVAVEREYDFFEHLLTTAKYGLWALLVPAVPLLLRGRRDFDVFLGAVVVWAVAASTVAVLQFFGVVREFRGYRPGQREPSFLGYHDLAAYSGAALGLAFVAIALGVEGRLRTRFALAAGCAGAVGVVLSGALAGLLGSIAAAGAAALVAHRRGVLTSRRVLALVGVLAVVTTGVVALRAANIEAFLRFIGIEKARDDEDFGGESYVQRLALAYIGGRVFLDNPAIGTGWQATSEQSVYGPYVDDAKRRFPKVPDRSLPSPEHPWGVQIAYVQAAAELGVPGFLLFLGLFAVALWLGYRTATRAPPQLVGAAAVPILWLLVVMGVWLGLGLVAGNPQVALQWVALGLTAAAASWTAGD